MHPKVLIDARMMREGGGGIARFVSMIALGLSELESLNYKPIFLISPEVDQSNFFGFDTFSTDAIFLSRKELSAIPKLIRTANISLFHSTSFSSLLPRSIEIPYISTLHDLNHLQYGNFGKKLYYYLLVKTFARGADRLLTVSKTMKTQIDSWVGRPSQVVYNAISKETLEIPEAIQAKVLKQFGLEKGRYFFSVTNEKPHKNVESLVKGYAIFRKNHPEGFRLCLSCCGESKDGVFFLGNTSDEECFSLLANAATFCFPSEYEGFGIPVVEAAYLGTPLIISDIEVHKEALQDLDAKEVRWVKPHDAQGWAKALEESFQGKLSRVSSHTQHQVIERYSPRNLAIQIDQIYRDVLSLK